MLGSNTYKIIATNLLKSIIARGNTRLNSSSGAVLLVHTRDGGIIDVSVCSKNGKTWLETTDQDVAITHYLNDVGAFTAMGDCTKYFREHR